MKYNRILLIIIFTAFFNSASGQALRVDFVLTGNKQAQQATIVNLFKVPVYSGGEKQNIPSFDYGTYRIIVIRQTSNDTLFIKGFCTLFEEWQTTKEASKISRAFKQTVEIPFPNQSVNLIIQHRQRNGSFSTLISEPFSPMGNRDITPIVPAKYPFKILHGVDSPPHKADILIIAEGYTKDEQNDFFADADTISEYLLSKSPYNKLKDKITIRALALPSAQSGTDDPKKNIWKDTPLNSSFNTFGTDRYLETLDTWAVFDYAAALPHDHIVVLANTNKYGGGGVYNHFSIASARHETSPQVFVHELGHGLAGLADEYYYSETSFTEFFDPDTEPWEPNLTTLVNFNTKWKNLVPDSVPIPTPEKAKYKNVTGVFEGGGYAAKGIYRPAVNCWMKSNEADGFCEVCKQTIEKIINFYAQ
jgi:hypothetical protein